MPVTAEGGDKIVVTLNKIADGLPKVTKDVLDQALDKGVSHSQSIAPVKTGRYRGSIRKEIQGTEQGAIVAGGINSVDYAQHIEFGTSRMPARPLFLSMEDEALTLIDPVVQSLTLIYWAEIKTDQQ